GGAAPRCPRLGAAGEQPRALAGLRSMAGRCVATGHTGAALTLTRYRALRCVGPTALQPIAAASLIPRRTPAFAIRCFGAATRRLECLDPRTPHAVRSVRVHHRRNRST